METFIRITFKPEPHYGFGPVPEVRPPTIVSGEYWGTLCDKVQHNPREVPQGTWELVREETVIATLIV
tara:strand:- start:148 stop:351 length:204 start_codon:yes stop_codon:yes gene_type:complete